MYRWFFDSDSEGLPHGGLAVICGGAFFWLSDVLQGRRHCVTAAGMRRVDMIALWGD